MSMRTELAARIELARQRLNWPQRTVQFRFGVLLALMFVVGTIWFTAVDEGNVAFGVFAGGLVAVLCASVFTLLTLALGSSERGWFRRD